MFWTIAYNIVRFFAAAERAEEALLLIEGAKKSKKVNKLFSVINGYEKELTLGSASRYYAKRTKDKIPSALKRMFIARAKNRVMGKIMGADIWYSFKYGIMDNFYWSHPLLDALVHFKDREARDFALQWITIYKLPPGPLRLAAKYLWKREDRAKLLERNLDANTLMDIENDPKLIKEYRKRTEIFIRESIKHCYSQYEFETVANYIRTNRSEEVDLAVDKVRRWSLMRDEITRVKVAKVLIMSGYTCANVFFFKPKAPITGNFMLGKVVLNSIDNKLSLWINNTWYSKKQPNYTWTINDISIILDCFKTRDFGRFYNVFIEHKQVPRPTSTYKKYNLNGTDV